MDLEEFRKLKRNQRVKLCDGTIGKITAWGACGIRKPIRKVSWRGAALYIMVDGDWFKYDSVERIVEW